MLQLITNSIDPEVTQEITNIFYSQYLEKDLAYFLLLLLLFLLLLLLLLLLLFVIDTDI